MLKMLMKFFKRNCFHTFSLVVAKAFNFGQFGEKLAVTLWERKKKQHEQNTNNRRKHCVLCNVYLDNFFESLQRNQIAAH